MEIKILFDILASVREKMPEPAYLVLGGFRILDLPSSLVRFVMRRFQEMGVGKAAPTHCTGPEAIQLFKEAYYGPNFAEVAVGKTIEV